MMEQAITRRDMLKFGAAVSCGVASAVVLAACSNGPSSSAAATPTTAARPTVKVEQAAKIPVKSPITLHGVSTYGAAPSDVEWWKAVIAAYEKANPGIKIRIAGGSARKIETELAGGIALDVGSVELKKAVGLAYRKAFVDLTDRVSKNRAFQPSLYYKSMIAKSVLPNGHWYALPDEQGPCPIFINVDLFHKHGVPLPSTKWDDPTWTKDAFLEMTLKLTSGKGPNKVWGWQPNNWWVYITPWVWTQGAHLLDQNLAKFTLLDPKVVEGFQFFGDLVTKYHVAPTPAEMNPSIGFASGNVAMFQNGPWFIPTANKGKFRWDVAPMPSWGAPAATRAPGSGVSLFHVSKEQDATWDFMLFWVSKPALIFCAKYAGRLPSMKSVAESDFFQDLTKKGIHVDVFSQGSSRAHGTPVPVIFNQMNTTFGSPINDLLLGRTTAQNMLSQLQPRFQEWLDAVPQAWHTDPRI